MRAEWRTRRRRSRRRRSRRRRRRWWVTNVQYVFAREHRGFFSGFSVKARASELQTHGCRERQTPHRERFAKEMEKEKTE